MIIFYELTIIVDIIIIVGEKMTRTIDATVARRQLGTLLDEVYHKGDSIIISRKGKPLAKIVPVENKNTLTALQKELLLELNGLPVYEIEKEPVALLREIRREKAKRAKNKNAK